jgi:hypothetical protein
MNPLCSIGFNARLSLTVEPKYPVQNIECNSSVLKSDIDAGKDGYSGFSQNYSSIHSGFANDIVGYSIGYFSGDYEAIEMNHPSVPTPNSLNLEMNYQGTEFDNLASDLYNGNIRSLVTSIDGFGTLGAAFRYDQLNRLVRADYMDNPMPSSNSWNNVGQSLAYQNTYSYDKNGNIKTLTRKNKLGLNFDDLSYGYSYDGGSNAVSNNEKFNNRLSFVGENEQGSVNGTLEDITNQNDLNYKYDDIGQLVEDVSMGHTYIWTVSDKKLDQMTYIDDSNLIQKTQFIYNPFGQRLVKINIPFERICK